MDTLKNTPFMQQLETAKNFSLAFPREFKAVIQATAMGHKSAA
jgi:hypothetical protein